LNFNASNRENSHANDPVFGKTTSRADKGQ
jgi:hypothetical protein